MTATQSQHRKYSEQQAEQADAAHFRGDANIKVGEDGPDGLALAHLALEAALDKKAVEPVMLEVQTLCSYASYLLILSGRSDRQVDAIAEGIVGELAKGGVRPLGVEGIRSGQWALLDFGDLIVHVFYHPLRERYDLESLWIDADRVPIEIPEEARATDEDRYSPV